MNKKKYVDMSYQELVELKRNNPLEYERLRDDTPTAPETVKNPCTPITSAEYKAPQLADTSREDALLLELHRLKYADMHHLPMNHPDVLAITK